MHILQGYSHAHQIVLNYNTLLCLWKWIFSGKRQFLAAFRDIHHLFVCTFLCTVIFYNIILYNIWAYNYRRHCIFAYNKVTFFSNKSFNCTTADCYPNCYPLNSTIPVTICLYTFIVHIKNMYSQYQVIHVRRL